MTKVLYNGEFIDLKDELEPGYLELDLLTKKENNLENTIEIKNINLEDTIEFNPGEKNEQ